MSKIKKPPGGTVQRYLERLSQTNKEKPKPVDIAELRLLLYERPEVWGVTSDLAKRAAFHTIESIDATPPYKESLRRRVQALQDDLGYGDSPALERLLIEQVALCWLRMNLIEYQYTSATGGSLSTEAGDFWERRLSAAQRRYTRACESLARVRKLTRNTPTLQVNIATDGGQQVNVLEAKVGGRRRRLPGRPERDGAEE